MGSSKTIWKKILIGITIGLCLSLVVSAVAIHERARYYENWGVKDQTAMEWAKEDFRDMLGLPTEIESREDFVVYPMANANIEW